MGTVPVPRTEAVHKGLLASQMAEEVEDLLFWQRWVGQILRNKRGEMIPSVAPIMQINDFATEGMDNILLPQLRDLTGTAFYGDRKISDQGEKQIWWYNRVYVNQLRFPVEGPARMSNLRVKTLDLINKMRPQLTKRMAKEQDVNIASSFYEGRSRNITAAAASFGLAKGKLYHPNTYVANKGLSTWSGTVATHANNIGTDILGLANDPSSKLTVNNLENMRAEVQKIPIEPLSVDGGEFWPFLVDHNGMKQLRQDPKYKESNEMAWIRGLNNPALNQAVAMISNFLIFERKFSVFGVAVGGSAGSRTLTFGSTNPASSLDTNDVKCGIIFGNGALGRGMAESIFFGEEEKDHGNYKEVSIGSIVGEARAEFYDVDPDTSGSQTAVDNTSSAIFHYFAPNEWSP